MKSKAALKRYHEDGLPTPLDVLMDNMRFAHHQALVELRKLEATAGKIKDPREAAETLVQIYKEMARLRDTSNEYARCAAPYMHSTLRSVDFTSGEKPMKRIVIDWGEDGDVAGED